MSRLTWEHFSKIVLHLIDLRGGDFHPPSNSTWQPHFQRSFHLLKIGDTSPAIEELALLVDISRVGKVIIFYKFLEDNFFVVVVAFPFRNSAFVRCGSCVQFILLLRVDEHFQT